MAQTGTEQSGQHPVTRLQVGDWITTAAYNSIDEGYTLIRSERRGDHHFEPLAIKSEWIHPVLYSMHRRCASTEKRDFGR